MRPISPWQMGFLRHVNRKGGLSVSDLRAVHQGTLHSLLARRYLTRHGDHINLTETGLEVVGQYSTADPRYRQTEDDLSERVSRLLRVARTFGRNYE